MQTIGLTATITTVDHLEGDQTSTAIGLAKSGAVYASYWRCSVPCLQCGYEIPKDLPCPGLRLAGMLPGQLIHKEAVDTAAGAGSSLLLPVDGSPVGIAASSAPNPGSIEVFLSGKGTSWLQQKVDSSSYPYGATWSSVTGDGHRVAYLHSMASREIRVTRWDGWAWSKEASFALPTETASHTAAFDHKGGLHMVWAEGQPAALDPAKPSIVKYRAPGQPAVTVPVTKLHAAVERLVVGRAGRAHLLVAVRDPTSQWPGAELHYATNAPDGSWGSRALTLPFSNLLLDRVALAVDGQGKAHVAVTARLYPVSKAPLPDEHLLLVGTNAHGPWVFRDLSDPDVTGAVGIAVGDGPRPVHVAYFGRDSFKLAEVNLYP